ncbi:hypothetical protein D1822_08045 [Phaeobacter inhibens]|nr:hypothetical protein PGA1_c16190 [Phaeobacter inhibens DSM 17395]AUQ45985.1 hypothetical protein PhaeoP10_01644 [Phaeobacter inhibens]AXT22782.1 hypothetical protein D1822_08045 [Phaeobacter inhibens]
MSRPLYSDSERAVTAPRTTAAHDTNGEAFTLLPLAVPDPLFYGVGVSEFFAKNIATKGV